MNDPRNIVVTGFMGTGKTTVSQIVAQRLGRQWLDMDVAIAEAVGLTIPEIFARQGEAAFRRMEQEWVERLVLPQSLVVATGGGALIPEANRQRMLAQAFVVCLLAEPAVIERRLLQDTTARPLAANWRDLYTQRQPAYAQIPQQIDTSHQTPQQVAQEIVTLWQNASR